jgi:inorganic triphosphatase YgiF
MGREFELKFRTTPEVLDCIRAEYGPFSPIDMETLYYDTPEGHMRRLRWTLRRRYENGVSVCTVKTPASGGGRGEWEVRCPDIRDAIPKLVDLGAPKELLLLAGTPLQEVCAARFTRMAAALEIPGATAELALDRGVLLGGGQELSFAEVEVELKAGSEAAVTAFADDLARRFRLEPEPKSKQQRALALAEGNIEHGQS